MPQVGNVVATWAETGKVHIYDISVQLAALEDPSLPFLPSACDQTAVDPQPAPDPPPPPRTPNPPPPPPPLSPRTRHLSL
jgi:hypothetical protein